MRSPEKKTATVTFIGQEEEISGVNFDGLIELRSSRSLVDGDSGSPCLYKVREGVYKMAGIVFAMDTLDNQVVWAFPASAAERGLGITFGRKLPDLSLNEQSGFKQTQYRTWKTLADFSKKNFSLETIDTSGSYRRWSGARIPATGNTSAQYWWNAYIPASDDTPDSIRFLIRGGPDIDSEFVAGRKWGFKVYIKRDGETAWKHVLSGFDELSLVGFTSGSDRKAVARADFTIPLSKGSADWPDYFKSDNKGDFEVKIEGAPINRAPTAIAGADRGVARGATVTLFGSGSDPDGDTLTYAWTQSSGTPVGLTNTTISRPSFTAPSSAGKLEFRLTVTDEHGASHSDDVTITVRVPNRRPRADAGRNQSVNTGDRVRLDGSDSEDPDGDRLTYRWTQERGTSVRLSSRSSSRPSFTAPSSAGSLRFRLTVTDEHGASDSDYVTITVRAVNRRPEADAGSDRAVEGGDRVTLDGSGSSDPDGDRLSYRWARRSGGRVSLSGSNSARARFTAPSVPESISFTFRLTVTDPDGLKDTDDVTITVLGSEGS